MARDVAEMRELMLRERPPANGWDLKLTPGGLVDIEFAVQALQVAHAAAGGPLETATGTALQALAAAGLADPAALTTLADALRLQSALNQLLKLALAEDADPAREPEGFRALLTRAAGCDSFDALQTRLDDTQCKAHLAYQAVLQDLARAHGAAPSPFIPDGRETSERGAEAAYERRMSEMKP